MSRCGAYDRAVKIGARTGFPDCSGPVRKNDLWTVVAHTTRRRGTGGLRPRSRRVRASRTVIPPRRGALSSFEASAWAGLEAGASAQFCSADLAQSEARLLLGVADCCHPEFVAVRVGELDVAVSDPKLPGAERDEARHFLRRVGRDEVEALPVLRLLG